MNFNRLNPLSSYLSKNGGEMSDWGIEELAPPQVNSSSLSHDFTTNYGIESARRPSASHSSYLDELRSNHSNQYHPNSSYTPHTDFQQEYFNDKSSQHDFQYYYRRLHPNPIPASTENFSKYIHKYLSLNNIVGEFWEKFKYNLVVTNLLDSSMILSKNEQALNELLRSAKEEDSKSKAQFHMPTYINDLNFDGSKLSLISKSYRLNYSSKYDNFKSILIVVNLIIFLLKQRQTGFRNQKVLAYASQVKIFKIILIVSSKLIKFKRFNQYIKTSQDLQGLNNFLLLNFKLNKKIIRNLISYKELEVFNFLDNSSAEGLDLDAYKEELKVLILNSMRFLNFNLTSSVLKLLPNLNGDLFEQYCTINNVDLPILTETFAPNIDESDFDGSSNSLDRIVFSINKFNQLRKVLICQLLSFSEMPLKKNFFVYKLMDQFTLDNSIDRDSKPRLSNIQKLDFLKEIFDEHNEVLSNFNSIFERFDKVHLRTQSALQKESGPIENQDILSMRDIKRPKVDSSTSISNGLNQMISKLSNLSTNLKFFDKYDKSTKGIENPDELNEKLMIFTQFNEELNSIKEIYHSNLVELQNDIYNQQVVSPTSSNTPSSLNSPRVSMTSSQGLKAFHNSSIKKRFSLPTSTFKVPNSPIHAVPNERPTSHELSPKTSAESSSGKKYKRLSTGLQLGLLTVFEDPKQSTVTTAKRASGGLRHSLNTTSNQTPAGTNVSYDDNYINILPPTNYETYNKTALDQLSNAINSKKASGRNSNRFSLNSMSSNVSGLTDLISSTQITSFADDEDGTGTNAEDQQVSQEELKLKLEESFNKIYNLENENKILKLNKSKNRVSHVNPVYKSDKEELAESPSFLSELEATLTKQHTITEHIS